jgi:hypothetical protein
MLSAAKRIPLVWANINIIDAGPERDAVSGDHVIPVANLNLGVAFAVAVEADLHPPHPYPLALYHGVRRHVEVLNPDAIAPTAAAPALGGHGVHSEADK